MDRRIWILVGFFILSCIFTLAIYYFFSETLSNPGKFAGAVYASWVSGLLIFLVLGLAGAVVSLAKPEDGSFDYRARVLFKNQSGAHIDYVVKVLSNKLDPYAESIDRKIVIKEFEEEKIFIEQTSFTYLKFYVDDADHSFATSVKYLNGSKPPNKKRNKLGYVRVNSQPVITDIEFDEKIDEPFGGTIPRGGTCSVEVQQNYWIDNNSERNTHAPARYAKSMTLSIENRLPGRSITIRLERENSDRAEDFVIRPGAVQKMSQKIDVEPGKVVYAYRLGNNA